MQKATLEGRSPKMEHTKQIINKYMCRKRYSKSKENNNEEKNRGLEYSNQIIVG